MAALRVSQAILVGALDVRDQLLVARVARLRHGLGRGLLECGWLERRCSQWCRGRSGQRSRDQQRGKSFQHKHAPPEYCMAATLRDACRAAELWAVVAQTAGCGERKHARETATRHRACCSRQGSSSAWDGLGDVARSRLSGAKAPGSSCAQSRRPEHPAQTRRRTAGSSSRLWLRCRHTQS